MLINSAGVCPMAEVLEFGRPQWDATVDVNLTAAFEMSYEVAQRMVPQRSGKIINICSMFSFLGGRMSPAYSATKHGIAGLTKAYCDELAQYNIQVNGIAPGYYATAITGDHAEQPGGQPPSARPHPCRALGRADRPDGRGRVPRQPGLRLRQRARARRRRRIPRPLARRPERMMDARYLVGIDCGTQSAKVVVYDPSGNAVATGQQPLRPMSRPRHGVAVHPDDDLWDSIATASREAMASFNGDIGSDRRHRSVHHPLLQGVPPRRRLVDGTGHQLDGRPRLSAVCPG